MEATNVKTPKKPITMRNHWFDHVRKTRKKLQRGNKDPVSHRDAMRKASVSWVTEKVKVAKRIARQNKKALKTESTKKAVIKV